MRRAVLRRVHRRRGRDDRGVAMFYVVAMLLVSAVVFTTLSSYVVNESTQSGRFRRESLAVAAAEGQVDAAVAQITTAAASGSLSCSPSPVSQWSGADTVTVTTTVTYFDSSQNQLACPLPSGTTATTATIKAVAADSNQAVGAVPVRRALQATLQLSGQGGNGNFGTLPSAIFADQGLTLNSAVTLTGGTSGAAAPNVTTNSTLSCSNPSSFAGSVFVLGTGVSNVSGNCKVVGDLQTVGQVNVTNSSVGGNLSSSAGSVMLTNSTVGGSTSAKTTVYGCSARCYPNSSPPAPRSETLPAVTWDSTTRSAWTSAGWSVVTFDQQSDCSYPTSNVNGPAQWLVNNASVAGGPVVLHTVCPLAMNNNVTVTMNRDVAVIADGGVSLSNGITFNSSTAHNLYLLQASNVVQQPCTTVSMSLSGTITFSSQLNVLFYSPCSMTISGGATFTGQMYSGNRLTLSNGVTMRFTPLPLPNQGQTGGGTTTTYTVKVTGKFESSS